MKVLNNFAPEWSSAPGDTVVDILEERNIPVSMFAELMGWSSDYAHNLIRGKNPITQENAQQLAKKIGSSADFWLNRERQYREDLSRQTSVSNSSWLKSLPVADLRRLGWLPDVSSKVSLFEQCLGFFDVVNLQQWKHQYQDAYQASVFRSSRTYESSLAATACWLRKGEIEAEKIECAAWNLDKFKALLEDLRSLTRYDDPNIFLPELRNHCAECGVAIVTVRTPTGCRASGATRFIGAGKAMLLLSFRYLSDDHFWFTFFHETGHLILHSKDALFVDGDENDPNALEDEANNFSASTLIPKEYQSELLSLGSDVRKILRFARKIGVSRGIVVGQLQHRQLLRRNQLNNLKFKFRWAD